MRRGGGLVDILCLVAREKPGGNMICLGFFFFFWVWYVVFGDLLGAARRCRLLALPKGEGLQVIQTGLTGGNSGAPLNWIFELLK